MSDTPELEKRGPGRPPKALQAGVSPELGAAYEEIARLKEQLAQAPQAVVLNSGQKAVAATPAYQDTDEVPEWITPSELCGVRLDEEVTIGSANGRLRSFRPGTRYRQVPYGVIRQAMALWGSYASGRRELLVNRGTTKTFLGAME